MIDDFPYILTIDIGTTNLKCIIYDVNGLVVAQISQSHPTYYSLPGYAEQNPSIWVSNLQNLLRELNNKHPKIIKGYTRNISDWSNAWANILKF